jgi:serine/threonine protein kinase
MQYSRAVCTLRACELQGGFGSVQICIHRASGKRFALKTIELELVKDKKSFEFFMREVEIMKNLGNHTNLHTIYCCDYCNCTTDRSEQLLVEDIISTSSVSELSCTG